MTPEDHTPAIDLSVAPDTMVAIRDEVRDGFVRQVHALRIQARAYRKAGFHHEWHQCRQEIRRMIDIIQSLDNPMDDLTFVSRPEPEAEDGTPFDELD